MATIADVANAQLARILANAGQPLEILAARQQRERAAQQELAARLQLQESELQGRSRLQEAEMAGRGRLQEQSDRAADARAKSLLELRQAFEEKQSELDRKNKLDLAEATGRAAVDRLNETQLAKLRAKYPQRKEESLEDWNARIQREQAKPINDVFREANGLRDRLEALERSEEKRRLATASKMALSSTPVRDAIEADDKARKLLEQGMSVPDIIKSLREGKRGAVADSIESAISAATTLLAEGADERGRPMVPVSPEFLLKQKAINDEISALRTQAEIQLRDPDFIGHGFLKFGRGSEALETSGKLPPGPETARALFQSLIRGDSGPADTGESSRGSIVPVAGEVRRADEAAMSAFEEANRNIGATEPSLMGPLQALIARGRSGGRTRQDEEAYDRAFAERDRFLAETMGIQPQPIGGSVFNWSPERLARSLVNARDPKALALLENLPPEQRDALHMRMLNWPTSAPAASTTGVQQRVAQLFGADANELLTEAAKLGEANGVTPAQQKATFDAALAGDANAQQQISTVLNYIRASRQRQFTPDFQLSE